MNKPTLQSYISPDGKSMLTWGEMYALVDNLATDRPERQLIVAIMDGEYQAVREYLGLTGEAR